jgi:hypothetical protein
MMRGEMAQRLIDWLTADRLRTWLVSALVGATTVALVWLAGLLGLIAFAWLALFAWLGRGRVMALSGMLSGFGFAWLGYLFAMYSMARVPDLALWLAIGLGALALGIGLLVVVENLPAAKAGRRRATPGMGRDHTVAYFRDLGGRESGPGVHEEDDIGRWGRSRDDQSS